MRFQRHAALFAAAALGLGGAIQSADAALVISYNGGATVVQDNLAGDSDPAAGSITSSAVIAGFGVTITVSQSNSPGVAAGGLLQVSSLNVQNLGAGVASLNVLVSDTDYTAPGGAGSPMLLSSSWAGTLTNTAVGTGASFQSFADPNNGQPAAAVATPVLTGIKTDPSLLSVSFSGVDSTTFVRNAGPYSLASEMIINLSPGGQANLSGTTTTQLVPEPASLAALAGLALMGRRRRA